jgi:hypothetical protein
VQAAPCLNIGKSQKAALSRSRRCSFWELMRLLEVESMMLRYDNGALPRYLAEGRRPSQDLGSEVVICTFDGRRYIKSLCSRPIRGLVSPERFGVRPIPAVKFAEDGKILTFVSALLNIAALVIRAADEATEL